MHLDLNPLSWREIQKVDPYDSTHCVEQMVKGFYPRVDLCHASYLLMYLERKIQSMRSVHDLAKFQNYLAILSAYVGKILNLSEIGKKCEISQTTATDWMQLLETTGMIYLQKPYTRNLAKRVIKAPKLFFVDTGLLCYLLHIKTAEELSLSPFVEQVFKNMVIMEKVKEQKGQVHYYKTAHGLEIDLLVDHAKHFEIYNICYTMTPSMQMTHSLAYFQNKFAVQKAALLTLRQEATLFSNGVAAEHWFHNR